MKANEGLKYFPEYTCGDPEDRDVVPLDHDRLFTACETKACDFTHVLFRTSTEGAEVFLGSISPATAATEALKMPNVGTQTTNKRKP